MAFMRDDTIDQLMDSLRDVDVPKSSLWMTYDELSVAESNTPEEAVGIRQRQRQHRLETTGPSFLEDGGGSGENHVNTSEEIRGMERDIYSVERLNERQREIYDYVFANPGTCSLIQAGPGTGKTFTMLTIAHAMERREFVYVMIYKHDLITRFVHCAKGATVARFIMKMLQLDFPQYTALEAQLSVGMNPEDFMMCVEGLLRRSIFPWRSNECRLLIIDEYTVIPKPLLYVILNVMAQHKVSVIVCGDHNQLQNIHNSMHTVQSSYDIAARFANRVFRLTKNERCNDRAYNEFVDHISRFSSERRVDMYGYALLSSVFYSRFIGQTDTRDIRLGWEHKNITNVMHAMVMNERIPTSFYYIDASNSRVNNISSRVYGTKLPNGLYKPRVVDEYLERRGPDKFLPYIPLIIGGLYFVHVHSEYSQATLLSINLLRDDKNPISYADAVMNDRLIDTLTMRMTTPEQKIIIVSRVASNDVTFDRHREFLLGRAQQSAGAARYVGQLYNFPIYLSSMMSIHMCQGRTIDAPVELILDPVSYQGLYVAVSRVTSPSQISRVRIQNMMSYMISTIINFPELCDYVEEEGRSDDNDNIVSSTKRSMRILSIDVIRERMRQYVYYHVQEASNNASSYKVVRDRLASLSCQFVAATSTVQRHECRNEIVRTVSKLGLQQTVLDNESIAEHEQQQYQQQQTLTREFGETMSLVLDYNPMILALSKIDKHDAVVWFHEFSKRDPRTRILYKRYEEKNRCRSIIHDNGNCGGNRQYNILRDVVELNRCYNMNETTIEYIVRHAVHAISDETDINDDSDTMTTKSAARFPWRVIIRDERTGSVYITTPFRARVYESLRLARDIDMDFLTRSLREMLSHANRYEAERKAAASTVANETDRLKRTMSDRFNEITKSSLLRMSSSTLSASMNKRQLSWLAALPAAEIVARNDENASVLQLLNNGAVADKFNDSSEALPRHLLSDTSMDGATYLQDFMQADSLEFSNSTVTQKSLAMFRRKMQVLNQTLEYIRTHGKTPCFPKCRRLWNGVASLYHWDQMYRKRLVSRNLPIGSGNGTKLTTTTNALDDNETETIERNDYVEDSSTTATLPTLSRKDDDDNATLMEDIYEGFAWFSLTIFISLGLFLFIYWYKFGLSCCRVHDRRVPTSGTDRRRSNRRSSERVDTSDHPMLNDDEILASHVRFSGVCEPECLILHNSAAIATRRNTEQRQHSPSSPSTLSFAKRMGPLPMTPLSSSVDKKSIDCERNIGSGVTTSLTTATTTTTNIGPTKLTILPTIHRNNDTIDYVRSESLTSCDTSDSSLKSCINTSEGNIVTGYIGMNKRPMQPLPPSDSYDRLNIPMTAQNNSYLTITEIRERDPLYETPRTPQCIY